LDVAAMAGSVNCLSRGHVGLSVRMSQWVGVGWGGTVGVVMSS
jgi:hypothetical protein